MVNRKRAWAFGMVILMISAFSFPPRKRVTLYLAGDSTMCFYEAARAPLTGWGMPFAHFFDSTVKIENRARGGRSTRTFMGEGRWSAISDSLSRGDYVLIQFGHNDGAREEKYKDRYTPVEDYKANLIRFITDTRKKGANPILITPVSRLSFKNGKAQETHREYSAAVHEVARLQMVPLIDLDQKSRDLYEKLGPENARLLFMQLAPGEHPAYPEGQKDNTHFNELGARLVAQLVLAEIKNQKLELTDHIIKPASSKI